MLALLWSFWKEMPKFILPLLWPPNLPDLNSVAYSIWSILQEKVYNTCITHLNDLKHRIRIRTEWAKLHRVIVAAAVRLILLQLSVMTLCILMHEGRLIHKVK